MKSISTRQARDAISDLANEVAFGKQHLQITRRERPVGKWVPDDWYERAVAALEQVEGGDSVSTSERVA